MYMARVGENGVLCVGLLGQLAGNWVRWCNRPLRMKYSVGTVSIEVNMGEVEWNIGASRP